MVYTGDEPRMRVNGATLPQYNGRPVVLLAEMDKIDPSGMMLMVKASDGQLVQVKLQQPLQVEFVNTSIYIPRTPFMGPVQLQGCASHESRENVEGIVEIHGTGQGRQVMCQNYVTFPLDYSSNFDMQAYDQTIRLIHSVPGNPWKFD